MQLIDHFGEQVLLQNYYQRFMQSLNKKTFNVFQVIGYLCKGYISRIHPLENIKNYIIYMLGLFKNHIEIHKIIKQIAQSISPAIVAQFQSDMISLIIEKMNAARQKAEYIQCLMAVVLALEDKFQCQSIIQPILAKNLKNQDWNVRKACVDICYTFIVVKQQINSLLHESIKQLKYDKIKNVRDSVLNYQALYKQVYGQQQSFKPQIYSQKTVRVNNRDAKSPIKQIEKLKTEHNDSLISQISTKGAGKVRNETFFQNAKNSDVIRISQDSSLSAIRSPNILKQQTNDYFQEQVPQGKLKQNKSLHLSTSPSMKTNQQKRGSKPNLLTQLNNVKLQKNQQPASPKFNLNLESLKAKNQFDQTQYRKGSKQKQKIKENFINFQEQEENERKQYMPIKKSEIVSYKDNKQIDKNLFVNSKFQLSEKNSKKKVNVENNNNILPKNYAGSGPSTQNQYLRDDFLLKKSSGQDNISTQKQSIASNNFNSIVQGQNNFGSTRELQQIKLMFQKFQQKVVSRLDKLQMRVQSLQLSQSKLSFGRESPLINDKRQILQNLQDSAIQLKNNHYLQYEDGNFAKKEITNINSKQQNNQWLLQSEDQSNQTVESNLSKKINQALRNQNIDQAYSLVLANNKPSFLLKLLQSLLIPNDKTVEQCLFLQLKKQLNHKQTLKWLKHYLIQNTQNFQSSLSFCSPSIEKILIKIKIQLEKNSKKKQKDYELLRNIVLNQLEDFLKGKEGFKKF